jgi:Uma2 family endonuclease
MESQLKRRLFDVKEYYRMAEAGIFSPDECIELIDGEVFKKSKTEPAHAAGIMRLTHSLTQRLNSIAIVSIHHPVDLSEFSEPEPDIALLKYREDFYAARHPRPKDILLVIEVADSTIDYDREVKIPLYARAKIPQAVIVNLSSGVVEVYTKPLRGKYAESRELKRGQALKIQKLPDLTLTVDEILG